MTVTDRVPPGILFMTFHYWESAVNELTNSAYDPISKTAEYKVCAVKIEKAEAGRPGTGWSRIRRKSHV